MSVVLVPARALFAQEPATYDDPFYKQKGQRGTQQITRAAIFFQVREHVDAFTGNLSLVHTDIHLPGNGGLDLLVQRCYNSRIWGRRDVSNPGLVALNERSVIGLGWSMHFGRARNPRGTGSANRFVPDNPVIEMPDGSTHALYRDRADTTRFLTRDLWRYRSLGGTPLRYELVRTDGVAYVFSQAARYLTDDNQEIYQVVSITTPNGNTIAFSYDSVDARKLLSITDTTGRAIGFQYSKVSGPNCTYDVLASIDVNGSIYRYEYSVVNCVLLLTRVVPPLGPTWRYSYRTQNPGLYELERIDYPTGAAITYSYQDIRFDTGAVDIPFSVVTQRVVSGRALVTGTWRYSYAATGTANQVTTVTTPCSTELHTFASFAALPNQGPVAMWRIGLPLRREIRDASTTARIETLTWQSSAAISDDDVGSGAWNGTTGFLYESQVLRPLLASVAIQQDGASFTTTFADYDAYGNPRSITEVGNSSRQSNLTYFAASTLNIIHGRPSTRAITFGSNTLRETFTYDSNGNMTTHDRFGVRTSYAYANGNLASETDALNRKTTYSYLNGVVRQIARPLATIDRTVNWDGTISKETDGAGYTTAFSYDVLGRLTRIAPPVGAATTITYDNSGGASRTITRDSAVTTQYFDGLGRQTGSVASHDLRTTTTYDACGRTTFESYVYSGSTPLGNTFDLDALGRTLRETSPDNSVVTYTYLSDGVASKDETGTTTTRRHATFGTPDARWLTSVTDPLGTTTFSYNAAGSMTRLTQPQGLIHTYDRDSRDFVMAETHPATGTVRYQRDAVGNMTSRADANGSRTMTYDAHDRLTALAYNGGTIAYGYDRADRRTSMVDPATNTTYAYDPKGRLLRHVRSIGSTQYTTAYTYDARDNAITMTYPTGRIVSLTYDLANRVTTITGFVNAATYHPSGRPSSLLLANGRSITRTYTNRYWVSTIRSSGLVDLAYSYDAVGNVRRVTDAVQSGRNQAFTYDTTHRLADASGLWGNLNFSYDAVGNRLTSSLNAQRTTYNYDVAGRLMSTAGAEAHSLSYDATGNVVNLDGRALGYDALGRMASVGAVATYDHDGDGRRVRRTLHANNDVTVFHYDRWGRLISETKPDGTRVTDYVYLNRELIARIDYGGSSANYGAGCKDSKGRVPRIGVSGPPPRIGHNHTITLTSAAPSSAAIFEIGVVSRDMDLTPIGMRGCRWLLDPFFVHPWPTDASGAAQFPLSVPNDRAFVGGTVYYQWFPLDPDLRQAIPLNASDGLEVVIGGL